jgi:DnaJ-class molecular chaperone
LQSSSRYTIAIVITTYLIYTIVDSVQRSPRNFYENLGIPTDASEADLKAAFRYFAKRNHPDRVGKGGEAVFIGVRDAYDALKDPLKRFAYDR